MKHLLLTLPLGLLVVPALGQHLEYSGRATADFTYFGGSNATATTAVFQANNVPNSESSRALNPYGSHPGTGGGLSVRATRVGKAGLLTAFDLGYDLMQSRVSVSSVNYNSTVAPYSRRGSGVVSLYTQAAAAFGGVGWRLGGEGHKLALDALVGPELAYVVTAHEAGSGTNENGSAWRTDLTRTPANRLDFRLRGELTVWRQRVGLVAGYSYGFTNYMPGTTATPNPDASLRLLRTGLAYRFK